MWTDVENDLAKLLTTRAFPSLAAEPAYQELFRRAGFPGKLPTDLALLPPQKRADLEQAARMTAQLLRLELEKANSLRERRAKVEVIEGPITLYRAWSNRHGNRVRSWWFSPHLLEAALGDAGHDRAKTLAWLRDRLAVSFDFGDCDRLAQLQLGPNSAVPCVAAWGLPMPGFTPNALKQDPTIPLPEYFAKRAITLQGQKTQYFLPYVPASRVSDYW